MGMMPPLFAPTPHIVATLWTPKKIFTSSCRRKLLYVKVDILSVGILMLEFIMSERVILMFADLT